MKNNKWQNRTELLIGDKINVLKEKHVLIMGLGGVGAYSAEQLCRAGIGKLTIIDGDTIQETNLNRQLPALNSTLGESKSDIMSKRLIDINPDLQVFSRHQFVEDSQMSELLQEHRYDYVVDAIDTLSPKIHLITNCVNLNINLVSSMGAGGKFNPELIRISDISKSFNCRLAYILRKKLRKFGISTGFKVVFSTEFVSSESIIPVENERNKKTTVGTISYIPAIFGCFCASVVIRDFLEIK